MREWERAPLKGGGRRLASFQALSFTGGQEHDTIVSLRTKRRFPMAWVIDPAHSEIAFSAKHLMISTVRGRFNVFIGTIDADETNPTAAKVEVQIDASSLVTG